jgi:hypothetical protein
MGTAAVIAIREGGAPGIAARAWWEGVIAIRAPLFKGIEREAPPARAAIKL